MTRSVLASLVAALLLAAASPLAAQPYSDPGTGVGAAVSYSAAPDASDAFLSASLLARTRLTGCLGLELSVTYRHDEFTQGGTPAYRLEELPIQASLQLFFLPLHRVQPFLQAGAGYYFIKVKPLEAFPDLGKSSDDQFTFHAGGGLDYRLSPRHTLFLDARYALVDVAEVDDLGKSAKHWQASLGFLMHF